MIPGMTRGKQSKTKKKKKFQQKSSLWNSSSSGKNRGKQSNPLGPLWVNRAKPRKKIFPVDLESMKLEFHWEKQSKTEHPIGPLWVNRAKRRKKISQWNSSLWNSSSTGKKQSKTEHPIGPLWVNRAKRIKKNFPVELDSMKLEFQCFILEFYRLEFCKFFILFIYFVKTGTRVL